MDSRRSQGQPAHDVFGSLIVFDDTEEVIGPRVTAFDVELLVADAGEDIASSNAGLSGGILRRGGSTS